MYTSVTYGVWAVLDAVATLSWVILGPVNASVPVLTQVAEVQPAEALEGAEAHRRRYRRLTRCQSPPSLIPTLTSK